MNRNQRRREERSTPPPAGAHLIAAIPCVRARQNRHGVWRLQSILDRVKIGPGRDWTLDAKGPNFVFTLFLGVAYEGPAEAVVTVTAVTPSGITGTLFTGDTERPPGAIRGFFPVPVLIRDAELGTYWLTVTIDGAFKTKVPVTLEPG